MLAADEAEVVQSRHEKESRGENPDFPHDKRLHVFTACIVTQERT